MKLNLIPFLLLSITTLFAQATNKETNNWQNLFNKKDLSNWEQKNGTAQYKIEGDEIVGISRLKIGNSFLCTKKKYSNFILEIEVKIHPLLNSGIQIRSDSKADYRKGAVHGYQVEIDPSKRAYTGGIYDESRRGWIYPLSDNEDGRNAFKQSQWNKLHIEAIGSEIRVWLNGVNTANIYDERTAEGFIALQVHSIGNETHLEGKEVRWRNVRIKTSDLESDRWEMSPAVYENNFVPNVLTDNELRNGWRLLWDGKTTTGWRSVKSNTFPKKGWVIKDGELTVMKNDGAESAHGGDIITTEKYSNFELRLDFKITKGANSGVKYMVDTHLNKGEGSAIGLECQLLDDNMHPDAKKGLNGNRTIGALYDLIPPENLSRPGHNKDFKGIGNWNQLRIKSLNGKIEHWLNGYKIVEYDRYTQVFRTLVAHSKYRVWEQFGQLASGYILLQDHGDEVSFRSIKIKAL